MRLANKEDIISLSELRILQQKDDWKEEFEDKYNLFECTKNFLDKHLNKDLYVFVEENSDGIISTCGLQIIEYLPQCNDNGKEAYICNVYTKEEYRCKGIQTSLLNGVIDFAKDQNISELNLSTDNEKAISIYKKVGFKFDDLIMKLKI